MKKILFLLFLAPFLSGCIPTLMFLGGATIGGMVIYDKRSTGTMLADHNIAYRARELINANVKLRENTHVTVVSFNKIVLLVGQAPTIEMRARVVALVRTVPKIRKIYNQITIAKPTSFSRRVADGGVTGKVKAALLSHEGFSTTQLKVVTENGAVYLMGLLDPVKGAKVAEVVRKISGVKQVVKVLESPK